MAKTQRVTLNDIAREVDMSRATVSAVLNENATCFASQKTRELIRDTARRMGYVPNLLARSMRSGRSYTVGMLSDALQLEIHHKVMVALATRLHGTRYSLNVCHSRGERELTRKMALDLAARGCDALVMHGDGSLMDVDFFRTLDKPVVLLPYIHPVNGVWANQIYEDLASGTNAAYQALFELGHRQIHLLCHSVPGGRVDSRIVEFIRSARAYGCVQPEDYVLRLDVSAAYPEHQKLFALYLKQHRDATALLVASDALALRLCHMFSEWGIRIPEDLSLVGFDGVDAGEYFAPPLSTVLRDYETIADNAYKLLMNLLEGAEYPVEKVVPTHFLPRQSCAPVRGYPELILP